MTFILGGGRIQVERSAEPGKCLIRIWNQALEIDSRVPTEYTQATMVCHADTFWNLGKAIMDIADEAKESKRKEQCLNG